MNNPLFALASLALVTLITVAVPGPSIFLVLRLAAAQGRAPALAAALGITLGVFLWCMAAALGLAAVMAVVPWLYKAFRLGGGLYLLWFSIHLWRAKSQAREACPSNAEGARSAFWRGIVICLTNPKSVLFFASIFAAYMGLSTPTWVHVSAIVIVVIENLAFYAAMALLFSGRRVAAVYARARKPLDRFAAAILAACGVGLLCGFS